MCAHLIKLRIYFTVFSLLINCATLENKKPLVVRLIRKYGYPVEEHKNILTRDGYLLDLQRIPRGLNRTDTNATNRPPVLLVHGLGCSAEMWVQQRPENGLAFVLADAGYDVWLANARGTNHSRKHTSLDPDRDPKFWQFSWHEIGVYDLPATIDRILNVTEQDSLFYVGHSQGNTAFFVMAAERPEYNRKIRASAALAPSVFQAKLSDNFLQFLARLVNAFKLLLNEIGVFEFIPNDLLMAMVGSKSCERRSPHPKICRNMVFLIGGYGSKDIDQETISNIAESGIATFSTKQAFHYAQTIHSDSFRQYDYGTYGNRMNYGTSSPPSYKLSRVSARVALFYSQNDLQVPLKGIERLKRTLPNVIYSELTANPNFNHLDFICAKNARKLVYDKMTNVFSKY